MEQFIEAVRHYPCLWDISTKEYRNSEKKETAWKCIVEKLNLAEIKNDIRGLRPICNNIIKILSKQSPLHRESAIVSRFIYKFDRKFRNDIGYRYFKKVNTALRRYLVVNLLRDIQNFTNVLPGMDDKYAPTRQMLEYVLVRLLTFTKIMLRICITSKQAAIFYLHRIKRGESYWMSLMPYALLCRVWSISSVLLQNGTQWYCSLYLYLDKLVLKGLAFLPNWYQLPNDIASWLDLKNLDNLGRLEWTQKKKFEIELPTEDNDAFENILEYVNQINEDTTEIKHNYQHSIEKITNEKIELPIMLKVDKGEIVSRDSFKKNNLKENHQSKYIHSLDGVKDSASLKEFLENEDKFRNESSDSSLTKHLSFMQWEALKISLHRVYKPSSKKKNLHKQMLKVWKEKCLDYS